MTDVTQRPLQHLRLTNPTHLLAVGFGSGLIHPAPGTWGSLAGLFIGIFFMQIVPLKVFMIFTAVCFLIGCYLCQKTANDMGVHDHGSIVWDEFVGIWIVQIGMVGFLLEHLILGNVVAFGLFRLFDIWKPFPIRYFDRKLENGFGIMIDDVLASLYAVLVYFIFSIGVSLC
ncbi:phosphatidylglycerophosphatase A [Lonepinella koalarum]|uniref:phosphatidylglycerophosphatase A family protein n=1 Tax=Lonepinella koalarum TaxID=53417 RepID=UPI0011E47DDD|nr:phosphatidylglycerophosphatase A [Lonepinella koalarum]TYG33705.1 phosphatidylglycerophosphatase A [Lonepinella koalarum]